MVALVDLKAAFDSVDRRILGRRLEEEKVSRKLRERIMEIYECGNTQITGRVVVEVSEKRQGTL